MPTPEALINSGAVAEIDVQGPAWQYQVPAATLNVPGTIAGGGTYTTGAIPALGMPHIAVGAQLTQAGSIVVQRYLDNAGSVAIGAAQTQALTANTAAVLDSNDGKLFQSFTVGLVNSGTVAATPSNVIAVLGAK